MKIYTKTGDAGFTSLLGGEKVKKNHLRIETYGTIDELNTCIGIVKSLNNDQKIDEQLTSIQHLLFTIGAELATPNEKLILENGAPRLKNILQNTHISILENWIDELETHLEILTQFIIPSGNLLITYTHFTRTVCRRAERCLINLDEVEKIRQEVLIFCNRLSDYLFVLARYFAKIHNINELKWNPNE